MPVSPQVSVTGTLADLFGNALLKGTIVFTLCGYGSAIPRVAGTALLAETAPRKIAVNGSGQFTVNIWGNDVITPAGTFYTVQILDSNGNVIQTNAYQFVGAGTVDISTLAPFNLAPVPPAVSGGMVTVPFSATPSFDASLVAGPITFKITLTGNVVNPVLVNASPGQLITFIINEDAVGGWTFVFPANVKNPMILNGDAVLPLAKNVQTFIFDGGNAYPIGAGTTN